MNIITTRRICQVFFLIIFLWFCVVTTLGKEWWQLRGWPVNWIIQMDPLVGLGTLLSTHVLYAGLLWGLATVVLTILLGRFFCGWVCPFGSIHQFVGYLGKRNKRVSQKVRVNRYHSGQSIKYWILIFLLTAAIIEIATDVALLPRNRLWLFITIALALLIVIAIQGARQTLNSYKRTILLYSTLIFIWLLLSFLLNGDQRPSASLQIGLLDPIPLLYRSINFILLPLLDRTALKLQTVPRFYEGTWLIGAIFISAVLLNLMIPRFYCRFVCPLGALFGVLNRFALWRIGKSKEECIDCQLCQKNCEGACQPTSRIRIRECVLCLNCLDDCHHGLMTFQTAPSAAGEIISPDLTRREFMVTAISGAAAISTLRIGGRIGPNWNPRLVRPPGSLAENEFLTRCIKCGQCMRICPTNVIHPATLEGGLEGLWTPILNFRIGTSGCQHNCIACGNLCPTAAIRPISLDERLGRNQYSSQGPIIIGTAFIDRGRCLPWAMDTPCIVCQENCPVSPKAIITREFFSTIKTPTPLVIKKASELSIKFQSDVLVPDQFATGDYYCVVQESSEIRRRRIIGNTTNGFQVSDALPFESPPLPGSRVEILIRLQKPYVDPKRCIGCGVCEHECPVKGKRAIRVTAENESRSREHRLIV
ncbi:MAG: 4Fe-4S binding protein [Desulfobacterales bacterium]|nr:MAG: 4Fe-4S binding protein [Desulfobacterales bacterium]